MSLGTEVRDRVRSRAPFEERVEQIVAGDGLVTVRCEVNHAEKLGCSVVQFELHDESSKLIPPASLLDRAERICRDVTYLLEPLRVIETDPSNGKIMVRSLAPAKRGNLSSYYELLTDRDHHLSLRRYVTETGSHKRRLADMILTNEQLEHLLDDLARAVSMPTN